jgi:ABC-type transport system involved in multi-copper enzyme maturation permease subunit
MIWLTWRQFRVPALVTIAALVVVAVVLGITGVHLHHLYTAYEAKLPACRAHGGCDQLTNNFLSHYHRLYQSLGTVMVAIPALIGIFWGPPLFARELETGTHRLAWTQSVTRTRWLAVKLGLISGAAALSAGLMSLMITWWARPVDHINANKFSAEIFSTRGLVPVGYAVFAFVFGAALGLVIRRTLPAMVLTLVGYVAIHVAVIDLIRPHLAPVSHLILPLRSANSFGFSSAASGVTHFMASGATIPNSLLVSTHVVDNAGRVPSTQALDQFLHVSCPAIVTPPPGGDSSGTAFSDCMTKLSANFHLGVSVIPSSRYWDLQLAETGLYLVLAAALTLACFWWIRNRLS